MQADVSDPDQARRAVEEAADGLGGLDILISNAGVEYFGPLENITVPDYERVFGTNAVGQLFLTQAAVSRMNCGARIVLTSTVSASMAVYEHTLYAASKAAVSAMVRLAPELARRQGGRHRQQPGPPQDNSNNCVISGLTLIVTWITCVPRALY